MKIDDFHQGQIIEFRDSQHQYRTGRVVKREGAHLTVLSPAGSTLIKSEKLKKEYVIGAEEILAYRQNDSWISLK